MDSNRPTHANAPLTAALEYTSRGWAVFPCHTIVDVSCTCRRSDCSSPAKHPLTTHGLHDATTDPRLVERWWRRWPHANVGVRTGAESRLVVLDIDPDHGGEATLAGLVRRHRALPDTLRVVTGSGGTHLYFRHPGEKVRNSAGTRLGQGLDVRGDGGYVIAPPSRHATGGLYAWSNDSALAPLPAWLLGAVRPRPRPPRPPIDRIRARPNPGASAWARAALKSELDAIRSAPEGTRNNTLNRAAFALGQIIAGGQLAEGLVTELLVDAGREVGLVESECRATVASGLTAGLEHPRIPPSRDGSPARDGRSNHRQPPVPDIR